MEVPMALRFPSLEFFQALQQRTKDDQARFEKLGYCDTRFGVRIGDQVYSAEFEVYECVDVREGGDTADLDFVLAGAPETWREMLESIGQHGGADAAHTLNTLSHIGDVIKVEFEDSEGFDKFYRYMTSIQEFFDQAQHLEIEFA
jgi:hypothetical protein